ncbi:MAG: hypothetical protein JWQ28_277, partial [Pedobacter sp.]|nr:hypothetical protein [Pedobacter sp.]
MKRTVLLFVFLLLAKYTLAQFDNTAVENLIRPDSNLTKELDFIFYKVNYVR